MAATLSNFSAAILLCFAFVYSSGEQHSADHINISRLQVILLVATIFSVVFILPLWFLLPEPESADLRSKSASLFESAKSVITAFKLYRSTHSNYRTKLAWPPRPRA